MFVEIRIKETLETAVNIPFGLAFDFLVVNIEPLRFETAGNIVTNHLFGLTPDEVLVTERFLVVGFCTSSSRVPLNAYISRLSM